MAYMYFRNAYIFYERIFKLNIANMIQPSALENIFIYAVCLAAVSTCCISLKERLSIEMHYKSEKNQHSLHYLKCNIKFTQRSIDPLMYGVRRRLARKPNQRICRKYAHKTIVIPGLLTPLYSSVLGGCDNGTAGSDSDRVHILWAFITSVPIWCEVIFTFHTIDWLPCMAWHIATYD